MAKEHFTKDKLYDHLVESISQAQRSVQFYSISCAFGFYSFGIKTFERVLSALEDRIATRHGGEYLSVRALVKLDHGNDIDVYAGKRLAAMELKYQRTAEAEMRREVFRALGRKCEPVQFVVVDGSHVVMTEQQRERYNPTLDVVLNTAEGGWRFDKEDDPAEVMRLEKAFEEQWAASKALGVTVPRISPVEMKFHLERFQGVRRAHRERDFQNMLYAYLQGLVRTPISIENMEGHSRIDLVAGESEAEERIGVEVKFQMDDKEVDRTVGEMRKYAKSYKRLFLVSGRPKLTLARRKRLQEELGEISAELVEIEQ